MLITIRTYHLAISRRNARLKGFCDQTRQRNKSRRSSVTPSRKRCFKHGESLAMFVGRTTIPSPRDSVHFTPLLFWLSSAAAAGRWAKLIGLLFLCVCVCACVRLCVSAQNGKLLIRNWCNFNLLWRCAVFIARSNWILTVLKVAKESIFQVSTKPSRLLLPVTKY